MTFAMKCEFSEGKIKTFTQHFFRNFRVIIRNYFSKKNLVLQLPMINFNSRVFKKANYSPWDER